MLWIFSTVTTAGHTALHEDCGNQPDYQCYGSFILLLLLVMLLYMKAEATNQIIHVWIFYTVTTAGHAALHEG